MIHLSFTFQMIHSGFVIKKLNITGIWDMDKKLNITDFNAKF